jgi:hypothetical protein
MGRTETKDNLYTEALNGYLTMEDSYTSTMTQKHKKSLLQKGRKTQDDVIYYITVPSQNMDCSKMLMTVQMMVIIVIMRVIYNCEI